MGRKIVRKSVSAISVAALVLGGASVLGVSSAQASPAVVSACIPETWTVVDEVGLPTYAPIGPAAGKFNPSALMSTLVYSLSQTTARSTAWSAGASASLGFGIAEIELNTSYTVTSSTEVGKMVADNVNVPAHSYGYATPKVEFRTFHLHDMKTTPRCTTIPGTDWGDMRAITAYPFFAECVSKVACTPRP